MNFISGILYSEVPQIWSIYIYSSSTKDWRAYKESEGISNKCNVLIDTTVKNKNHYSQAKIKIFRITFLSRSVISVYITLPHSFQIKFL